MIKNLDEILPGEMSDESAYHLVNFLMELALLVESHYFSQIRRHIQNSAPLCLPSVLEKKRRHENDI